MTECNARGLIRGWFIVIYYLSISRDALLDIFAKGSVRYSRTVDLFNTYCFVASRASFHPLKRVRSLH